MNWKKELLRGIGYFAVYHLSHVIFNPSTIRGPLGSLLEMVVFVTVWVGIQYLSSKYGSKNGLTD